VSKCWSFSFIFNQGKKRKVGWDDSQVVFDQKFPGEKGSMMVHCHDTTSSFVAKLQGKVLAHFHAVTIKHRSSMQN
jgi:hypothetical protein